MSNLISDKTATDSSFVHSSHSREGLVLLYHRINTLKNDPWRLAVESRVFSAQLKLLKQQFSILPLNDLGVTRKKDKKMPVYITFDDGYLDNFTVAKPLLEYHHVPCTFFITTDAIGSSKEFWWDALENIVYNSSADALIEILRHENLNLGGNKKNDSLEPGELFGKIWAGKRVRTLIYYYLWEIMYKNNSESKTKIMETLHNISSLPSTQRETHKTMTPENIYTLAKSSLFDLGGHGVTHDALGNIDRDTAHSEMEVSHRYLNRYTDSICAFSYPHGSVPEDSIGICNKLDIDFAFTTQSGVLNNHTNVLEIPRLTVENWSAKNLIKRINRILKSS